MVAGGFGVAEEGPSGMLLSGSASAAERGGDQEDVIEGLKETKEDF